MTLIPEIKAYSRENNPYVKMFENGYTLKNFKELINARHKSIVEATLEAAWQEKSPVIVEIAESEQSYCAMEPERLGEIMEELIAKMLNKYNYSVPVALHMDHVQKDISLIDRAVKSGFSSVEADFSKFPLNENIEKSKEVVQKLHPLGVSVELEEGEIGSTSALVDPDIDSNIENYYTKVEDAKELAAQCRPDALAIFVGNGHGKYLKEPKIGIERIREIAQAVQEYDCPIVLHGGSYLSNDVFNAAIDAGVAKINYATAVSDIMFDNLPADLIKEMEEKGKELNKPLRKVLYLFLDKLEQLDDSVWQKTINAMVSHIRDVMKNGFRSSGMAGKYQ